MNLSERSAVGSLLQDIEKNRVRFGERARLKGKSLFLYKRFNYLIRCSVSLSKKWTLFISIANCIRSPA